MRNGVTKVCARVWGSVGSATCLIGIRRALDVPSAHTFLMWIGVGASRLRRDRGSAKVGRKAGRWERDTESKVKVKIRVHYRNRVSDMLIGVSAFKISHGFVGVIGMMAHGVQELGNLILEGSHLFKVPLVVEDSSCEGVICVHLESFFNPRMERFIVIKDALLMNGVRSWWVEAVPRA